MPERLLHYSWQLAVVAPRPWYYAPLVLYYLAGSGCRGTCPVRVESCLPEGYLQPPGSSRLRPLVTAEVMVGSGSNTLS